MTGAGSKLPAIIRAASARKSRFRISLVVSHRSFSAGVVFAISKKIPAIYFKLPDYRKRLPSNSPKARADYMKHLGWFISQREYQPALLVFAGWDLVMDKNFFNFFKANFGNGFAAINLHPGLLPKEGERGGVTLPDGTKSPIFRGEQQEVLEQVLKSKVTYFGPTVHFMIAGKFDTGRVIGREFIKVQKGETISSLRKKLMPIEDKLLVKSINEVVSKYL